MATYEEIQAIFTSSYSGMVQALDTVYSNKFNNISESTLNPNSSLSTFYDSVFCIGEKFTFEDLSIEFEKIANEALEQMNNYLTEAKNAKAKIMAAISQDATAKAAAETAYNNVSPIMKKDKDGNVTNEEDTTATLNARKKAYEDAWNANCWKPA